MAADDLRLNSLEGFAKKSPRFILEEHAHCEVPAGCGGVVLRWLDSEAGLPMLLDFFHRTPAALSIDGSIVTTSRVLLSPGRHILSIEFSAGVDDDDAVLILVGRLKIEAAGYRDQVVVRSIADGSWLFATDPAPEGWTTDFDLPVTARTLDALVSRVVIPPQDDTAGWAFRRATEHGGEPIGTPRPTERRPLHVRTVFTVPCVLV